ncbi:MAG: hypothetical protein NTX50_11905 [Candidatus Sumerlaeota bacterium]|nr:hypothetical protein [Candidatus Sumerlaeota bacterium]
MSDHDDMKSILQNELAAEPRFDSSKSGGAIKTVMGAFDRRLKQAERIVWLYIYGCTAVAIASIYLFYEATSLKAAMAFGFLFVLGIETSVLVKLWYWIANAKISLQKDMKLLRMQGLAGAAPEEEGAGTLPPAQALSKVERGFWLTGLIAICLGIAAIYLWMGGHGWTSGVTMRSERTVTLEADGNASIESRYSFPNETLFPLETWSMFSDGDEWQSEYRDFQGHKLETTKAPEGKGRRETIKLAEPVAPGQRLLLKDSAKSPHCAKEENGVWTYRDGQSWGYSRCEYYQSVALPKGATVVEVSPKPNGYGTRDGLPAVLFSRVTGPGANFKITIKYRL